MKSVPSSARILTMQKFIEADYYELDWYYEECSDGNYGSCENRAGLCRGTVSWEAGEGVPKPSRGHGQKEGALETGTASGRAWL